MENEFSEKSILCQRKKRALHSHVRKSFQNSVSIFIGKMDREDTLEICYYPSFSLFIEVYQISRQHMT